jgi:ethanolamine transporter EutH
MVKLLPVLFAEVCITILGGVALAYGLDGAIFATTIAAIAGLGGYAIRTIKPPTP